MSARTLNDNPERNPSMTIESQVTATARDAGRSIVHTVDAVDEHGLPVRVIRPTRRSATNRYAYAIARWGKAADVVDGKIVSTGERIVIVERWSNSPKASGMSFAVRVQDVDR